MSTSGPAKVRTSRASTFFLFQRNRGRRGFQSHRWLAWTQRWWRTSSEDIRPSAERAQCGNGKANGVRRRRRTCRRVKRDPDSVMSDEGDLMEFIRGKWYEPIAVRIEEFETKAQMFPEFEAVVEPNSPEWAVQCAIKGIMP